MDINLPDSTHQKQDSSRKRPPQPKRKPRTNASEIQKAIESIEPIIVRRPDINFRVLRAFKKQGLNFIDLETGSYVDGLVPLPSIGLSFTPSRKKTWKSSLGFLNLGDKKGDDTNLEIDSIELDAILFFEYKGAECITGVLDELEDGEKIYLFFLTIWNDYEFKHWNDIVEKVVADLTIVKNGVSIPLVNFTVTTSYIPNNPTEANRLVIEFGRDKDDSDSAVSDQHLVPDSDDCEDSLRFKPRY